MSDSVGEIQSATTRGSEELDPPREWMKWIGPNNSTDFDFETCKDPLNQKHRYDVQTLHCTHAATEGRGLQEIGRKCWRLSLKLKLRRDTTIAGIHSRRSYNLTSHEVSQLRTNIARIVQAWPSYACTTCRNCREKAELE